MTGRNKVVRLSKAAREFNISLDSIVGFLTEKGYDIERKPNTKLDPEMYELLTKEFQDEKQVKEIAQQKGLEFVGKESISIDNSPEKEAKTTNEIPVEEELMIKNIGVSFEGNKYIPEPVTNLPDKVPKSPEVPEIPETPETIETTEASIPAEVLEDIEIKVIEEIEEKNPVTAEEVVEEIIPKEPEPIVEPESSPEPEIINEVEEIPEEKNPADKVEEVVNEEDLKIEEVEPTKEEIIDTVVENTPQEEEKIEEKVEEKPQEEPVTVDTHETLKVEETQEEKEGHDIKVLGKIDLDTLNQKTRPKKKTKAEKRKEQEAKSKTNLKGKDSSEANSKKSDKESVSVSGASSKEGEVPENNSKKVEEKSDTSVNKTAEVTAKKEESQEETKREGNFIKTKFEKLTGPKILDKIELPTEIKRSKKKKPVASSTDNKVGQNKKKRKRIKPKPQSTENTDKFNKTDRGPARKKVPLKKKIIKAEPSEEEIQKKIKDTLARLAPAGKSKAAKHRRRKRDSVSQTIQEELQKQEEEKKILKVTEFVTANELGTMMNIGVTDIITSCMQLGLFVSINQRLDAETIVLVAEEFGYQTSFVSVDEDESLEVFEEVDDEDSLVDRAPIVTVMGHVDHGKTKLLDYIRNANVVSGEAGGITQHIGAYEVKTETGKRITFLDTPGHEAFTAMRARGAKVTDVAIIVIAADDSVMPQTKEAINHAQAAGVPIVFAINKMDKAGANSDKVKEQLANMNILVEDWGGKFQSQEISAITGLGINELLEKVLLESEMLELKANADKLAKGTVIEASLDKGRGYVTTILVQDGTLTKGDIILAGPVSGKVKAMFNERNEPITSVGPSQPVLILGLIAAPQTGDVFNGMKDEKEAKALAAKRQQLIREQSIRTQKHVTLDEIGRRIAIGDFKEINIIVKGDVDGSIEALTDSLIKLSTTEIQVNVIHKAVGAISESDVMLASASDAIIIGFQVRPSVQARKRAEKEQIDIRLYSIIYQATEELETAIKGMLTPKTKEKNVCNVEVRETFRITKVGTIAGCYVLDGKVKRNTKVRVIRDGIVVYTGLLGSLKRFKDDVKEVASGYECGLNIENFNDIKVGDIVEGYEMVEISR
jgi:translation initiation factor IF-2